MTATEIATGTPEITVLTFDQYGTTWICKRA